MGGFRSKAHITNTQHKPFVWTAQTSNGQGTQLLHAQSMPLEGPPGSWLVREGGCARTQDTDPAGTRIPPLQSSLLPTRTCCPARFETVPLENKLNLNASHYQPKLSGFLKRINKGEYTVQCTSCARLWWQSSPTSPVCKHKQSFNQNIQ